MEYKNSNINFEEDSENESVFDGKECLAEDSLAINSKTCHGCGGTFLFALSLIF